MISSWEKTITAAERRVESIQHFPKRKRLKIKNKNKTKHYSNVEDVI